jgi:5-methylcytosine-specific restriction endonuclease McrA
MKRKHLSTSIRVKIFEKECGLCHLCNMKVSSGQEWDVSHEIPLEIGGADDMSNWRVAHRKCHRTHTAKVDIPRIAKSKRVYARYIGAKVSRNTMPGSRRSKWKRKMDGTVVLRD